MPLEKRGKDETDTHHQYEASPRRMNSFFKILSQALLALSHWIKGSIRLLQQSEGEKIIILKSIPVYTFNTFLYLNGTLCSLSHYVGSNSTGSSYHRKLLVSFRLTKKNQFQPLGRYLRPQKTAPQRSQFRAPKTAFDCIFFPKNAIGRVCSISLRVVEKTHQNLSNSIIIIKSHHNRIRAAKHLMYVCVRVACRMLKRSKAKKNETFHPSLSASRAGTTRLVNPLRGEEAIFTSLSFLWMGPFYLLYPVRW